jgi:hypothetical protein
MRIYMQTMNTDTGTGRFCQLLLHPDLLGGWTVMRETGRQGAKGRTREEHHTDFTEATESLYRWRDKLINDGFKVVFVQGEENPGS